jgi:hypothetical protein
MVLPRKGNPAFTTSYMYLYIFELSYIHTNGSCLTENSILTGLTYGEMESVNQADRDRKRDNKVISYYSNRNSTSSITLSSFPSLHAFSPIDLITLLMCFVAGLLSLSIHGLGNRRTIILRLVGFCMPTHLISSGYTVQLCALQNRSESLWFLTNTMVYGRASLFLQISQRNTPRYSKGSGSRTHHQIAAELVIDKRSDETGKGKNIKGKGKREKKHRYTQADQN